ncbi:hypothetical protein LEN26_020140 [Aphanomyces euteiches]|nr:hypothetical protein LEN26_020140 [Aphanomyces euteiches]KAH9105589.1 hypothetical protein AeMF1_018654 [Aphanomyces euteiches]KAH9184072.1 hypothetical protein AeNC1_013953 [Aphanomyces euteiches]
MTLGVAAWTALLGASAATVTACSDFLLNSTSNVISARTMDFNLDLATAVEMVPVGTEFVEQSGFTWTNKLGFLSFNVHTLPFATDGLNTEGLSAAWLYMTDTIYPTPNLLDQSRPVVSNLCSYVLGNFATVDEVKLGLQRIQPTGIDLSNVELAFQAGLGPLRMLPLHISVHDAFGASIVIEFLHGTMYIVDNPLGVLTNEPAFDDQLANLASSSAIPGGYSSSDRFVRLVHFNRMSNEDTYDVLTSFTAASQAQSGVARALHVLNTVVQPIISSTFATEWIVVRDHQRRYIYIQDTESSLLRRIDLNALDFHDVSKKQTWIIAQVGRAWYVDATDQMEIF